MYHRRKKFDQHFVVISSEEPDSHNHHLILSLSILEKISLCFIFKSFELCKLRYFSMCHVDLKGSVNIPENCDFRS